MSIVEFLLARIAEDEEIARDWRHNRGKVTIYGGGTGYLRLVSPEHLLSECAAKRAIVEECDLPEHPWDPAYLTTSRILRTLATIYADHPDHQEEWKP